MNILKIIAGAILGFFSFITIVQMAGEERGAGLAGALTGFLIFAAIATWLIYSGVKGNKEKDQ